MVIRRAAIGIALALLAACGRGGPSARPAARATQERAPKLESTLNVVTGASSIYSLIGWNHYIAWAAQTRADSPPNRVVVYDLTTKTKRIVARTTSSSSEIDYIRGDEDTLVYAELARTPSDQDTNGLAVPWSIHVVDLSTGKNERILSVKNDRPRDATLPFPSIDYAWVANAVPARVPGGGIDVDVYDLHTRTHRTALSSVRGGSGFDVTGDSIVFSALSGQETYDLFEVGIDGNERPRKLTTSGQVSGNRTANDATAWREPADGQARSLWWLPRRTGAKAAHLTLDGIGPIPGRGFVVWLAPLGDRLLAQHLGPRTKAVVVASGAIDVGARWSAFGDRVVWATRAEGASPIVHVARVAT